MCVMNPFKIFMSWHGNFQIFMSWHGNFQIVMSFLKPVILLCVMSLEIVPVLLDCFSELYIRQFILYSLRYDIVPSMASLRNQMAYHLVEEIIAIIDDLEPEPGFPILLDESDCTRCGKILRCLHQDCHTINAMLTFLNTNISSSHRTSVTDITDTIINTIQTSDVGCVMYNGSRLGNDRDVTSDVQYRVTKDSYNLLLQLQQKYSTS